jgi:Protein of Unknown function (DUF2784)
MSIVHRWDDNLLVTRTYRKYFERRAMCYRFLADALVLGHIVFILFAVFGGLLVLRRRRMIWLHLPAATWTVIVQTCPWYCPLTTWENQLRLLGGQAGYETSFVDHYLLPILYPASLAREVEILLGVMVLLVNLSVYAWVFYRWRAPSKAED